MGEIEKTRRWEWIFQCKIWDRYAWAPNMEIDPSEFQ